MKRIPLFLKKKMESILLFLDKYSNVLIAFSACLTTIATFLIWGVSREQIEVSREQIEVSRKQAEYTHLTEKAATRPVIQIDYISETLHEYTLRNNLGSTVEKGMEIWTVQIRNIGRGTAFNLKIEHRGRDHKEEKGMLMPGEKYEYFIPRKEIESGGVSSFAKVTYQDIFKEEFITDIFRN